MDVTNLGTTENNIQTEGSKEHIIEIEVPYPLFQYLSSEDCDLQNICRICLSVNDPALNPLFSAKDNHVLANMFMAICEVQMSEEDELPSKICIACQTEVMNYYEFKMKCVKSDYTLKSILKGEFVSKEEGTNMDDNSNPTKKIENNDNTTMTSKNNLNIKPEVKDENTDIDYLEDLNEPLSDDEIFCKVRDTIKKENNSSSAKKIKKNCNETRKSKSDLNVEPEVKDENTDIEYLEEVKESLSDDETLCIVRDTINKQKEITFLDNDPKMLFKDIKETDKQKRTNRGIKKVKHHCTYCPKKFHKPKTLKAHISKHHAALVTECLYPCGQCKDAFDSEFDLNVHGMLHNQSSTWKCTECHKDFKGRPALRRHIQRHMHTKRFSCDRCGKSFVELYALQRHARVHTGELPEKKHACQHCDKRFPHRGQLSAHMSRHGAVRSFLCVTCGAAFPSARLLASHGRVHSTDKPHACAYCNKRFRHESTRNTHHRTHTGERPYVCPQCGKAFIQKSNMTLHMRTHTGERPYSCPFCERKFSSGSTLKAHKRTHTGERPYSCKICGKSFARVNMKQHMRLHSGERPHACPACPKRFSTLYHLKDHHRQHTGEKPFECALCTQMFTSKSQLIKHYTKKHDRKKKASKKVMLTPVTVSDKTLQSNTNPQPENKLDEYMIVNMDAVQNVPNVDQANLCTVHETPIPPSQQMTYEDDEGIKTHIIVLDNNPNLIANNANDVNLVTVNEGEVSISAASTTLEGTTVKLYQYDQSLLQIHTGGGQLTISRISSKMTTNF